MVGDRTTASVDSPLPGDDDVLRGATIREESQVVFLASQFRELVSYISRPFDAEELVLEKSQYVSEECLKTSVVQWDSVRLFSISAVNPLL
jgi:hypothetical protein